MSDTRIYVASLSDYNAGRLHGVWIDCEGKEADEIMEEVSTMLAASPTCACVLCGKSVVDHREGLSHFYCADGRVWQCAGPAEEWAIHDYEGFGTVRLSEYESLDTVVTLAEALTEHGDAFAAWCAGVGVPPAGDVSDFQDAYAGEWDSIEEYAQQLFEDTTDAEDAARLDAWPFTCIDWERAAKDLIMGGDIWTADAGAPNYGVYVFRGA